MRYQSLAIVLLLPVIRLAGQSPVTIDESDLANAGDSYILSNGSPALSFDAAGTGADYSWDYSTLSPMSQDTSMWVNVTATDPSYFLLWFSSNVAEETGQDFSYGTFSLEDVDNFYERQSDALSQTAMAGILSGIPFPVAFDNPDIIYALPVHYGDTWSSETGYMVVLPGIGTWIAHRNRSTTVDGWGSLSTPFGTFDVLRLRSEVDENDTISTAFGDIPIPRNTAEYKWLAQGMGIPVLQINTQILAGFETVTQVMYRDSARMLAAVQNPAFGEPVSFSIDPNPATGDIYCRIALPNAGYYVLKITDMSGRQLYSSGYALACGKNTLRIPKSGSNLMSGTYVIHVESADRVLISREFIYLKR